MGTRTAIGELAKVVDWREDVEDAVRGVQHISKDALWDKLDVEREDRTWLRCRLLASIMRSLGFHPSSVREAGHVVNGYVREREEGAR